MQLQSVLFLCLLYFVKFFWKIKTACCSSDDNSLGAFRAPQNNRLDTNYDFSRRENDSISGTDTFKSKTTDDETSEMVDNDSCDGISGSTSIRPLPQLVAHQDYSFFETPAIRCSTNSADDIAKRIRCGGFGDDIANEIKRKLENQLTYSFTVSSAYVVLLAFIVPIHYL